jgi:hypothetical protein
MADVISFMKQQLGVLKDMDNLVKQSEGQTPSLISPEDMAVTKNYISNMKTACNTILTLTKAPNSKPEKAVEEQPPAAEKIESNIPDDQEDSGEEQQSVAVATKPKPRSRAKKAEPVKEEPVKEEIPIEDDDDLDFLN